MIVLMLIRVAPEVGGDVPAAGQPWAKEWT